MRKGVIWAGALAGSNQAGAMVTCQAQFSPPVGLAWAPAPTAQPTSNNAITKQHFMRWHDFTVVFLLLPESLSRWFRCALRYKRSVMHPVPSLTPGEDWGERNPNWS